MEVVFGFVSTLIPVVALYLLWRITLAVEAMARTRSHSDRDDNPPLP